MGALLSLPTSLLNLLLPFTDKSTPLAQDLIHTALLCGTLYFAPQIVALYNSHEQRRVDSTPNFTPAPTTEDVNEHIRIDERLVLQEDEDDPPPVAPMPPPDGAGHPVQHPPVPPEVNWEAEAQQRPAEFVLPDQENGGFPNDAQPGPANLNIPRATPQNRTVGTKKAKSLARKDQRRAYHEFHRQEAELRRQRDAEGKEERDAVLAAEKVRRLEAERAIQEREREERERKKVEEKRQVEEERSRRERAVVLVKKNVEEKGAVDLVEIAWKEGKDKTWIEKLVRASGLLGQLQKGKEGGLAMITGAGWLVSVDADLMTEVYKEVVRFADSNTGKVGLDELGVMLEEAIYARAKEQGS